MRNHAKQAQQLYQALFHRGQTWTRNASTLSDWASQFEELLSNVGSRRRIQKVLDWYCSQGCGALFVPLIGNAESFRTKFEQIDKARKRLKGQTLRYFDDVLQYEICERQTGSQAQKECSRVMQRVQQQIEFVDDLAHGRIKLPKPKAASRNGHTSNGKALTKTEKQTLADWLIVSREALFQLMMQNPVNQKALQRKVAPIIAKYANTQF